MSTLYSIADIIFSAAVKFVSRRCLKELFTEWFARVFGESKTPHKPRLLTTFERCKIRFQMHVLIGLVQSADTPSVRSSPAFFALPTSKSVSKVSVEAEYGNLFRALTLNRTLNYVVQDTGDLCFGRGDTTSWAIQIIHGGPSVQYRCT